MPECRAPRRRCARSLPATRWPASSSGLVMKPSAEHEPSPAPLLQVKNLVKHFPIKGGLLQRTVDKVHAVDGVSFDLAARRDAGRGRRIRLRQEHHRPLHPAPDRADLGRGLVRGPQRHALDRQGRRCARWRATCRSSSRTRTPSLNPRMTVGAIVGEALTIHAWRRRRASTRTASCELLETVGLSADHMRRYPHEFSRRPAPAHRHRTRAGREPQARGLRRGGVARSTCRSRRR
jgi:ABC-type microcin C transport system duplicated ATPase subunit YejF